mgnify:CR=1 FL=1
MNPDAICSSLLASVAAVGERPGVWVSQTWHEIEEDD